MVSTAKKENSDNVCIQCHQVIENATGWTFPCCLMARIGGSDANEARIHNSCASHYFYFHTGLDFEDETVEFDCPRCSTTSTVMQIECVPCFISNPIDPQKESPQ